MTCNRYFGEVADQRVSDTVGEVFLARIAGNVVERQHEDRQTAGLGGGDFSRLKNAYAIPASTSGRASKRVSTKDADPC